MDLPAASSVLTFELDSSREVRDLEVTATGVDEAGGVHTAPLQPIEPGVATYEMQIEGAVRLLSITIHRTSLEAPDEATFDFTTITVDDRERCRWTGGSPLTWRGSAGSVEPVGSGLRFEMDSGASDVIGGIVPRVRSPPRPRLPRLASSTGPVFPSTLGGQQFELDPVATATQFPSMLPNAPFIVRPAPRCSNVRRPSPSRDSP